MEPHEAEPQGLGQVKQNHRLRAFAQRALPWLWAVAAGIVISLGALAMIPVEFAMNEEREEPWVSAFFVLLTAVSLIVAAEQQAARARRRRQREARQRTMKKSEPRTVEQMRDLEQQVNLEFREFSEVLLTVILVLLGFAFFGAVTLSTTPGLSVDGFEMAVYAALDLIPLLDIPETLGWEPPLKSTSGTPIVFRVTLLAMKLIVLYFAIRLVRLAWTDVSSRLHGLQDAANSGHGHDPDTTVSG